MGVTIKISTICILLTSAIVYFVSKLIFDRIYHTSKVIIDEEFHLPLGEAYCKLEFHKWDPKVTTLPGLYLLSSLILGPFQLCSIYWLRSISLGASIVNFLLFYAILSKYEAQAVWKNIISSVNLALLPPLYFFSHLYYTDVVSLTMTLAMVLASEKGNHYVASVLGFLSIIVRQTNIIWVGMVAGKLVLTEIYVNSFQKGKKVSKKRFEIVEKDLIQFFTSLNTTLWISIKRTSLQFWLDTLSYVSVLISFVVFVFLNGSIVVGDKSAHEATIHLPQLFYFSLFCLIFAWPHFVTEILNFALFARRHKIFLLIASLLCILTVYCNTLVHPYLLADNRHYIFYIYNRFYEKFTFFRYGIVVVYIFALYVIIKKIWKNDVSFALLYLPCITAVLISERLIEVRYYFVPYVLFRLHLRNVSYISLLLEFVSHCFLIGVTLNIFFTKTIQWEDFDYAQRIIW